MPSRSPSRDDASTSGRADDLLSVYAPEPNALERRALGFLDGPLREGSVPLNERDRERLKRLQRRTMLFGVASGTLSGLFLGGLEIWLVQSFIGDETRAILDDPLEWGAFYVVVGLVTLAEILFLYWITLKAVARLKEIVGVPGGSEEAGDLLRAALARAALETPNPHAKILGIDPHAFTPRWQLFARNLAYKAKVGLTSFILRIALRRLFVRAVLRSYVPLLAAPLYAAWNAWILHSIMEEARIRAFGPFAVRAIAQALEGGNGELALAVRTGIVELVRRSANAHPNYVLLLHAVPDPGNASDDPVFEALTAKDRQTAETLLSLTAVLAGSPSRAQLRYLRDTQMRLGRSFDPKRLIVFKNRLREGHAVVV